MVLRISQLLSVLLASLALGAAPALAQSDPGEVVRFAAAAMDRVANATSSDIRETTDRTLRRIAYLDRSGASDEEIIAAGRRGIGLVNRDANAGERRIFMIATRAAHALREMNADRRFFAALFDARDGSIDQIRQTQRRAVHAIRTAVDDALGG